MFGYTTGKLYSMILRSIRHHNAMLNTMAFRDLDLYLNILAPSYL